MFDKGPIKHNFKSAPGVFPYAVVAHGIPKRLMIKKAGTLPPDFKHHGKVINIKDFMTECQTTGMVVMKDDTIVWEKYFDDSNQETKFISWSVGKTIVGLLVGIAVDKGLIKSVEDPVDKYDTRLTQSGYKGVTIKNCLQMSSGIKWSEEYGSLSSDVRKLGYTMALGWSVDQLILSLKSERPQGTKRMYNSADTQVLAMVIRAASGMSLAKFCEEHLWKVGGFSSDMHWLQDDHGVELAFGTCHATLRDYAKIGQIFLNREIVPAQWIRDTVTADKPHLLPGACKEEDRFGYGYQMWLTKNSDFMAIGIYGQFIYMSPAYGIVIAKSTADYKYVEHELDSEETHLQMFRRIAKKFGYQK